VGVKIASPRDLQEIYKDSDPAFAFIAGYTSWGFPYGLT
jgi:hypothetical protein